MTKSKLRRIEATLDRLNVQGIAPPTPTSARSPAHSFKIETKGEARKTSSSVVAPSMLSPSPKPAAPTDAVRPMVRPMGVASPGTPMPMLPKFKLPSFSSHRHVANPNLAMGLLKELEGTVEGWQTELHQVLIQIQAIYLEGPIVDGWLESHPSDPKTSTTGTLRHVEVEHLMDYVQELYQAQQTGQWNAQPLDVVEESPRAGYRLCGLDADGQLWARPCPPEQLPYVSLAIARYQKLRQLLGRKQDLENRLSQLSKTLIALHSQVQDS